jgi:hypothetical protein
MATCNFAVILDQAPKENTYPANFFPRGFHYLVDAHSEATRIINQGGKAHVVPKPQFTTDLILQLRKS